MTQRAEPEAVPSLVGLIAAAVAVAMSLFHIWVLVFRAIDPWHFRSLHVAFAGVLVFFWFPGWKGAPKRGLHWADALLLAAGVQGRLLRRMGLLQRDALLIASLALIKPGLATDLLGLGLLALVAIPQHFASRSAVSSRSSLESAGVKE